jgi:DNA-binding CsgD family transcriptional regulator
MQQTISPKHHLWSSVLDIKAICQPLFSTTEIKFFNYARAYDDGSITALFTHPEWLLHTLEHKVAPSKGEFREFKHLSLFGTGMAAPSYVGANKYDKALHDFSALFGFDYLLCFNYQQPEYYEAFAFASASNNSRIIEYYLNNIDYLENFISYFKSQAELLIKKADDPFNRIIRINENFNRLVMTANKKSTGKDLLVGTQHKVHLSQREFECLKLLTQGRTAKEIASFFKISNRTIEAHIYNMKVKLGCHKKSQLIDIALENNIPFSFR